MTAKRSLLGRGVAVRLSLGSGVTSGVATGVASGVATGLALGVGAGVGLGDGAWDTLGDGAVPTVGSTLPVKPGVGLGEALGIAATSDGDATAAVVGDGAATDAPAELLGSWKPVSSRPPRWSTNPNEKPADASRTRTAAMVARGMREPGGAVSGFATPRR